MPRKLPPPAAVAPIETLLPPLPPSPIIQTLRKDWRWAAISQFIWTFSDAFGLVDWDIEALEADFDGDEKTLIPTLIAKLLFALTYNRQINRDNAFESLRKTYAKRRPESKCLLGTEEAPVEWETLGLSQKVQILHELCEWQLEDPARFRGLLKSEEEAVSWRVEPVGWDKDGNTYWLFDDNRLWIQRLPPPPPPPPRPLKKSSQKAKKAARKSRPSVHSSTSAPRKSHKKREITPEPSLTPPPKEEEILSGSGRRRKSVNFYGNPTPTAQALKRGSAIPPITPTNVPGSSRSTRSTRNNHVEEVMESPSKARNTPLPLGTRVSRRLRNVDDEWQQVPEDWLSTPAKTSSKKGKGKAKKSDGDESELSELTDEEEHERMVLASGARKGKGKSPVPVAITDDGEEKQDEMNLDEGGGEEVDKMDVDPPTQDQEQEQVVEAVAAEETVEEPEEVKVDSEYIQPEPPAVIANGHEADAAEDPQAETSRPDAIANAAGQTNGDDTGVIEENETQQVPIVDGEVPVVDGEAAEEGVTRDTEHGDANGQPEPAIVEKAVNGDGEATHVEAISAAQIVEEIKPEVIEKKSDLILSWEEGRSHISSDFVEWEAVCVTLYEWRTVPEQFAKSKDADEQALYALLTEEVGPTIIGFLVAKEQERIKQEAVNNRKRSSRIATRELEREEIMKREAAEREMEERMERIRTEEIRKQREEDEAVAIQKAREDRLKEREERALAREEALLKKAEDDAKERERRERRREKRKRRREGEEVSDDSDDETMNTPRGGTGTGTATPSERWELNCEVCKKVGWNIDEDLDLVCCDDCGRWQHTECHDRLDAREGRPGRNWDQVDFKCKECQHRAARKKQRVSTEHTIHPPPAQYTSQANGHSHAHPHPLSQSHSPYPVLPGSSPGPHARPPIDPSRPPPPPLGPGEFYLPYPHPPAREDRPAGYAVFYPPGQQQSPSTTGYQGSSPAQRYPATPQSVPSQGQPQYPSPSQQGYQVSPQGQFQGHPQAHPQGQHTSPPHARSYIQNNGPSSHPQVQPSPPSLGHSNFIPLSSANRPPPQAQLPQVPNALSVGGNALPTPEPSLANQRPAGTPHLV
ncbi:hypothetical protein I302_102469 [Kwoniella bestiolae CBS 10118]|uniref:PHD-type domain-containing protein n=1 Tax=Kwoniella bestiolae CBS 10118 TaxID=1296100 RepID=A0A1B9GF62_9TREE|nr:hypothetical protein I302_01159 [Kwoniella bestiolae CBS 10118]OCF29649.1 hypothetical protein I302_01159 [Kwoniella bestiolae CBS 10118]